MANPFGEFLVTRPTDLITVARGEPRPLCAHRGRSAGSQVS